MSLIEADTVAPSAGGTPRNLPRGVAAAWMDLTGTGTIAVRDSLNLSSIIDSGVGQYDPNFASAMASANYAILGTLDSSASAGFIDLAKVIKSALKYRVRGVYVTNGAISLADFDLVNSLNFGSLAP